MQPKFRMLTPDRPQPPLVAAALIEKHHVVDRNGIRVADPVLSGLASAVHAVAAASQDAQKLTAALDADGSLSPDERKVKLRSAVMRLGERAASVLDGALAATNDEIAQLDIDMQPPPSPEPAMEGEIRAALRGMDAKTRGAFLSGAIKERDPLVTRAALRAPPLLSGLGSAELALFMHQYRVAAHPDKLDRQKRLRTASEVVQRAGRGLVSYLRALSEGSDEAAAAHSAAMAALAEIMGDAA
jgi:hypothetical protein